MSAIEEFESILKELPTIKAPGVSGTRIKKLTDIAIKNVGEESKLITILYSNCKAVPSSHKLGTLYVVDSIVRGYAEEAKKLNQTIDVNAEEGTFAAGVYKISELIENLIDNAMELSISKSQNIKISKLVDIWERAETFDSDIISKIRQKHFLSTTPPGTPPRTSVEPIKPTGDDSNSILSALASLAKTNSPKPSQVEPNTNNNNNNNQTNSILSQLSAISNNSKQAQPSNSQSQGPNGELIFNMLQQMQNGNIPPQQQKNHSQPQNSYGNDRRSNRDANDFTSRRDRSRSPTRASGSRYGNISNNNIHHNNPSNNQYSDNQYNQHNNPYGQQNNQYGQINSPQQQHNQYQSPNQYGGPPPASNQYGQSPQPGFNQLQSNPAFVSPMEMGGEINAPGTPHFRPRNVGFDQTLPQGSFKVLSRTLFIGGVPRTMDEKQLATVLRPFAEVQSVILNSERKHAFVKVYSRREAEQVITSFNKDGQLPLRTRWGVGFGPRDCCNYQHGISIIPIQRLTDADKAWVVKAQWGGTGGEPLQSGIVIDEPDIEIGAGISSKAMSKKMPTNSARNGPKSNKPGEPDEDYVKTTLMGGRGGRVPNPQNPDFNSYNNNAVNPLAGLFNNQTPQTQQPQYPPQQMQYPPSMPNMPNMPNIPNIPNTAAPGFQDFMQNMQHHGGNMNMYQGPPPQ